MSSAASAPTVESESVSGLTEHGATLEARINPGGFETTYAFWVGHDVCSPEVVGYEKQCHVEVMGPLGEGYMAGDARQLVSAAVTGLEANELYVYVVAAVNSIGHVVAEEQQFRTLAVGGLQSGPPPIPENKATPYEPTTEPGVALAAASSAAQIEREYEEQRANEERKAKQAEEEQEAANRRANQLPPPLPIPAETIPPDAGEVSLVGSKIAVRRDGVALVKLGCKAGEGCIGTLTLTVASNSGAHGRSRKVTIATRQFSIRHGASTTVKLVLNRTGRALLDADHGRLSARMVVVQPELGPEWTRTKDVRLEGT
ncbi:MAG TPA: hypothetical protein VHY18_02250 [Solirubrobacteraceae bacterium]|nr:hypothetical protein [Solirubrobacteraceae bacterium]